MFWEYSGDASGTLLGTVHHAFYGNSSSDAGSNK
jgi:hypothetical protein